LTKLGQPSINRVKRLVDLSAALRQLITDIRIESGSASVEELELARQFFPDRCLVPGQEWKSGTPVS
jgi:hypothetical protein